MLQVYKWPKNAKECQSAKVTAQSGSNCLETGIEWHRALHPSRPAFFAGICGALPQRCLATPSSSKFGGSVCEAFVKVQR